MNCIKNNLKCTGRACNEFHHIGKFSLCCSDESEMEIVQNIIDAIDSYSKDSIRMKSISSNLSFLSDTIDPENSKELQEILNISKRVCFLLNEDNANILEDDEKSDLVLSFTKELGEWLTKHFLVDENQNTTLPSIIADMDTLDLSLGVCYHNKACVVDDITFN